MSLSRALAVVLVGLGLLPSLAAAEEQVAFTAAFSPHARLGQSTSVSVGFRVDPGLPPVTDVRILTPAGLTLANSQLGATSCHRPSIEIRDVLNPVRQRPCPPNSLLGYGTAHANLIFSEEDAMSGAATIELHAGAPIDTKPGLILTAETLNPARMQLTYGGYLYIPPPAFGLGLAIKIRPIVPPPFGAQLALSSFQLVVGAQSITYNKLVQGRRTAYHPGGIPLPRTCPRAGFRFRTIVSFSDATRRTTDALARCPRRATPAKP